MDCCVSLKVKVKLSVIIGNIIGKYIQKLLDHDNESETNTFKTNTSTREFKNQFKQLII